MPHDSPVDLRRVSTLACSHCGLPATLPIYPAAAEASDGGSLVFCCRGCLGAYELIHGWGLEDYYKLRETLSPGGGLAVVGAGRYDDLDDPALLGRSAPQPYGDQWLGCRLAVSGLHCGACAWLIERAARLVPGWHSVRVRMNDHTLDLLFDPRQTRLSQIALTLDRLGYRIAPLVEGDQGVRAAAENRRMLINIAMAGFFAANAMWIAVALYAGDATGIAHEHQRALRWAGVILGTAAVAIPGRTFFRGAWGALRTWTPHMDLPLALGLGVGTIGAVFSAVRGSGDVYFDSLAVLVFVLLIGRWVQFRQQRRAAQAVHLLMRLAPRTARRIDADGSLRTVPTDSLRPDDCIEVAAGEGIPADGIVVAGTSLVDRSLMTGESQPVAVQPDSIVEAGTANLQSPLQVRVTAVGLESRAGGLMRLVEEGAATRSPLVQFVDRIGGWFVAIVILLALLTIVLWWPVGPEEGFAHAVALLVVACPCALAMATPLAIAVTLGRAAKGRIFIRGGDVLERLARPGVVWFDKTGTLTQGVLEVTSLEGPRPDDALAMAAVVEQGTRHPLAAGILRAADQRRRLLAAVPQGQLDPPPQQRAMVLEGSTTQDRAGGVCGIVDGVEVLVGNVPFLRLHHAVVTAEMEAGAEAIARRGATPVFIALDGQWGATLGIEDQLRPEARAVVDRLRQGGWEVGILSGDHPETVAAIARQLQIAPSLALGSQTPEEKLARIAIAQSTARGHQPAAPQRDAQGHVDRASPTVMMVGDGVNDAAALAAADVGVAVRGGAEASLEAAPVYLADGKLIGLADLVEAARRTSRVIRRNFAISLSYNLVVVVLAMAGKMDPLVAAILMPISSLTVLSLTLGSRTFSPDSQPATTTSRVVAAKISGRE